MMKVWLPFTRVQLLLLIVVSTSIDCEAFVGSHTKRNQIRISPSENLLQTRTSTALPYTHSSEPSDPSLLQSKVLVLQDVVKEMDARHRELLEQSEHAKQEYNHKLETLEKDLEESKTAKGDQESAIASIESVLEETIEKHALDLEKLEHTKDQEREEETKKLQVQNEEYLEKLRNAFEERVQELEGKLETKEAETNGLSAKLKEREKEASNDVTEKDAIIAELKEQIEAQKKQIDSATVEESKEDLKDAESSESSAAIEALKIEHQEVLEDYKSKLDALEDEKDQLSFDLKEIDEVYKGKLDAFCDERSEKLKELEAKHQWVVEDYEARLDAIFAEKEGLSSEFQTQHQEVVESYEAKLKDALAANDKLAADLTDMQAKCEEQVEIATASVKAGEAREASLRKESEALTLNVQLYWIAAKLTNLVAERTEKEYAALLEEKEELEEENEELHHELETTKRGVQDLIEQLENQNNMWAKLRSKVTGTR